MAVAKTLAYYITVTIMTLKSFIVQGPEYYHNTATFTFNVCKEKNKCKICSYRWN